VATVVLRTGAVASEGTRFSQVVPSSFSAVPSVAVIASASTGGDTVVDATTERSTPPPRLFGGTIGRPNPDTNHAPFVGFSRENNNNSNNDDDDDEPPTRERMATTKDRDPDRERRRLSMFRVCVFFLS